MTLIEHAIQMGMTGCQPRSAGTFTALRFPRPWGRCATRQLGPRNSLMNAGMTIFLGWFVGGRASAILRVSMAVHVPGLADTDLTSILSPWDRSIPTSDARGMPCGLARDVGQQALHVP